MNKTLYDIRYENEILKNYIFKLGIFLVGMRVLITFIALYSIILG